MTQVMRRWWLVWWLVAVPGLAIAGAADRAAVPPPAMGATQGVERLDGTGANTGNGWRRAVTGTWYGTGGNTGQTWRQDVTGTWRGGGTANGQSWRPWPRAR